MMPIPSAFASVVKTVPEAIAIAGGTRTVTYRALDEWTDDIADALWAAGVRPGEAVMISAERSIETVAMLLGILKCGAFYVPVDPRWPAMRLAYIASQTAAKVAVWLDEAVECGPGVQRIPFANLKSAPGTLRRPLLHEQAIAYVMFTSGSTGVPKAIAIPHCGVVRLALRPNFMTIAADDVFLYHSTLAFDASTFEIWTPLLNGCRLEVCPPGTTAAEIVRERGVTALFLTTAFFTVTVEEEVERLIGVRTAITGGDVLSPSVARRALRMLPGTRVVNAYGPTENSAFTTCHTIRYEETEGAIPIGHPVQETYARVVDDDLRPLPAGEKGELVTGGLGLAHGYFGNPALTAERFVPDPDPAVPGARLYRTGDVVRQQPDGAFVFVGRDDDQVKISGFRIELGEIAHAAMQHRGVRDACALVRGGRVLLWCITDPGTDLAELPAFLGRRLPPYMLPAAIVPVDAFPLNPSGKINRALLPDPAPPRSTGSEERSAVEKAIAQIWSDVLDIPLPPNDLDFFEAGGDSLSAMRVMNRLRAGFGVTCSSVEFFENGTVRRLAAFVTRQDRATPPLPVADLDTRVGKRLPVTFPQERVWFLQQLEPESVAYQFQSAIVFRGELDVDALRGSLDRIVERHEIYRTTFIAGDDGNPVQVVHESPGATLDIVDLSDAADPRAEFDIRVAAEIRRQFDPTVLPLVRWVLYRISGDEHRLIHIEHHLVHDGWSFNLFLADLVAFYREATTGVPAQLAPPLQSGQFALRQRHLLDTGVIDRQVDHCVNQLQGAGAPLALPFDRPRPARQTFRGDWLRLTLGADECAQVVDAAARRHCTPFMLMLAAFADLLHRHSGTTDLVIGTGFANRDDAAAESAITMAVNTVALRCDLAGNPTTRELASRIRQVTLDAYENQSAPFDRVVARLRPDRDPGANPLFQTMFSFHDAPDVDMRLPKLDVGVIEGIPNGSSKFDLNVVVIRQNYTSRREAAPETWRMIWEYNSDLFDRGTVERLAARYRRLLAAHTATDSDRIADLEPDIASEAAPHAPQPVAVIRAAPEADRREPHSLDLENMVAAAWMEVLEMTDLDRDADFFVLGGHSLMGVRINARLNRQLGVQVPLSLLFETRTVRRMAAALALRLTVPAAAAAAGREMEEREL